MLSRLRIFDWTIVVTPLLLLLIGVVVIYTVTFPTVEFTLARQQIIYSVIAVGAAVFLTLTDYRSWQNSSFLFYLVGLGLLISLFFIGSRQFGASRWIDLGIFDLQPSEVFKLILILVLARLLSSWSGAITLWRLALVAAIALVPIVLTIKQPDLGTAAVLMAITAGMLLFARLPWRWWLVFVALAAILVPYSYAHLKPYQRSRVQVFLHPEADPTGEGYNVRQAAIAIGSGGLAGQGLGRGSQSQLNFLPVAHTDFIFSGLAEATGLVGSLIVIVLYFVLLFRIIKIAEIAKDSFGMYVALGVGVMLGFQVFVNIGMNLGLMPVTGIPLPFVSFGGTSLIVSFASLGLVQSIYIRHKKITF